MTLSELRARLAYWQHRCAFQDWTIKIRWARHGECDFVENGEQKQCEALSWWAHDRLVGEIAIRRLNDPLKGGMIVPRNIDNDIVHEIYHAIFDDPVKDDRWKEQAICRLTRTVTGHP